MPEIVTIDATPGPAFVAALRSAWEAGDAVFPLDTRLSASARRRLLEKGRGPVADGTAVVIASSGSTGEPRLVELSHVALRASSDATATRLGAQKGDAWAGVLPLHHIAGFMTMVRTLHAGAEPLFDLEGRSTFLAVVPTMLRSMIGQGMDLTRWRAILVGGGPIPAGLREETATLGGVLITSYGQTETCGGVVYDGVPLEGTDLEVRSGEIYVKGPTLMTGYLNDEEATARRLRSGWLATGDEGSLTEGKLTVTGRVDDVIITGGEKVSPIEIESLIAQHPKIADAAVVGVEDERWGQRVVAAVVASSKPVDELELWLRERVEAFKVPKEFVWVERIPRTELGKVRRNELRELMSGRVS